MHLGNGALTLECAALAAGVAAAGLTTAVWSARKTTTTSPSWLAAGMLGGLIFAAQMVNVPLLPYSSGHFVGGVLLAVLLRPGLGALTMAIVLALQAILLGDGGVLALGANIINMALLPAGIVAVGQHFWKENGSASRLAARRGMEAALAIVLAAMLLTVEVALFRGQSVELSPFAGELLWAHVVIGLAEGAITGGLVYAWLRSRPSETISLSRWQLGTGWALAALLIGVGLPWASQLPDGYEAAAQRSGWELLLSESNHHVALWQHNVVDAIGGLLPVETVLAILATLLVGLCCGVAGWMCRNSGTIPQG